MATFCRITGNSRNLPKPCYFPLLPPISPVDAKKLCKITGKAHDLHHYVPIIAFAKPVRFDGIVGCRITKHEDFCYLIPIVLKTKDNERSFEYFKNVLNKIKSKKKRTTSEDKLYVYNLDDHLAGIVFPPEIEEGIRLGEFDSLALSKDNTHLSIKLKQGRIVKVKVEPISKSEVGLLDNLYFGEGQSKAALEEQQKILNDRNRRKQDTMARKKVFEDKEKKEEEEERKATQRPKPKPRKIKFDPQRRTEKMKRMEMLLNQERENRSILLPKYDPIAKIDPDEQLRFEQMLHDIKEAQSVSVSLTVYGCDFDWAEAEAAEAEGFDFAIFPHEEVVEPVEIGVRDITHNIDFIPTEIQPIEIAASVETVVAAPAIDEDILKAISNIGKDKLTATKDVTEVLEKAVVDKILPEFCDFKGIVENSGNLRQGFLVEKDNKIEFVPIEKYTEGKWRAVSGAMVKIENTEKFITGQIINAAKEDSFIAGQTIETSRGLKFVPGQTVVKNGKVTFIPGKMILEDDKQSFVAGHIVDESGSQSFKPGQTIDRGDGKPTFMPGQTIVTENGPKFVPGEVLIDDEGCEEFIPGLIMQDESGDRFIPGQAFQSENAISFTPGQIIETDEGPSFIPGKSFKMANGDLKFIRGTLVQNEAGKTRFEPDAPIIPIIKEDLLIPNEALKPVAVPESGIVGIFVKPTNTDNVQAGEKIYGSIVETEDSILFYLEGKLPEELLSDAKIITGQLVVGGNTQKFIPGKMMAQEDGKNFVPGQNVCTSHGEEFVPGQLVETTDGPKFVPGQVVLTSEGEKFVPGQVIYEEDVPKFVPGHIIQTENGATFIPGQMMTTDEGQKFIPGQLVETKEGPMFVPGQVLETCDGPRFLPGTIVETEEGLKYVPSEADDQEDELEISFQAFDLSPEELMLITNPPVDTHYEARHTPISGQQGLIDSATLSKLALDTVTIHGRTPEPTPEMKRKKKKGAKVAFDAPENEESEESDVEDSGDDKVDVLKRLMNAASTVSNVRRERELRNVMEMIGGEETIGVHNAEIEAIIYILSNEAENGDMLKALIGDDDQIVPEILSAISNIDNIERNDQVTRIINNALKSVITRRCDKKINDLIERLNADPECLFTDSRAQILLTEAVGIVCVTGDIEVATLLEKFISEPTDPTCLRDDKDVLAVLRQLLVLHEISHFNPEVANVLTELKTNPENVKDHQRVEQLIKKAKKFIRKDKLQDKPFNIRHVASSKDIPNIIFEQLRESKEEAEKFIEDLPDELIAAVVGDKRCGEKFLDSLDSGISGSSAKAIQKFRKGMVVVVTKDNMQAVIPRHHSRSVCYGIVPYLLIDEDGFKFFERGLTGRKLAPSREIKNTWYEPEPYYPNGVLRSQRVDSSGQEYRFTLLGQPYGMDTSSLYYTSLLPSGGPNKLSYSEAMRRSSRESSVASFRPTSSSTPTSRRSSVSSLYEPYSSSTRDVSRRSSVTSGNYPFSRSMTPSATERIMNGDSHNGLNSYSKAVVPFALNDTSNNAAVEDDDDELVSHRINRSDTVTNLLDKYSNFSVAKEFDSNKYSDSSRKYGKHRRATQNLDDELLLNSHSFRSSITPENSVGRSKVNGEKLDDEFAFKNRRKLSRPFSDIYEVDEIGTPTNEQPFSPRSFASSDNKTNLKDRGYSDLFESDFDEDRYIASLKKPQERGKMNSKLKQSKGDNRSLNNAQTEVNKKPRSLSSQMSLSDDDFDHKTSLVPLQEDSKAQRRRRRRNENIEDTLYKPSSQPPSDDIEPMYVPLPRRTQNPLSRLKLDDDDDDDEEGVSKILRSYKRNYSRPSTLGYAGSSISPYPGYNNPNNYNSFQPRGPAAPPFPNQYGNPSAPYMGTSNYGQPNFGGMGYNPGMPPSSNYGGNQFNNPTNYPYGSYGGPPGGGNYPPSSGMNYPGGNCGRGNYGAGSYGGPSYTSGSYGGGSGGYVGSTGYGRGSYGGATTGGAYGQGSYLNDTYRTPNSTGVSYSGMNQSGLTGGRDIGGIGTSNYGTGIVPGRTGTSSYESTSQRLPSTLKYLDDDDDDDDDADTVTSSYDKRIFNPKMEQRKLATKLARQYLVNNSSDDDDE